MSDMGYDLIGLREVRKKSGKRFRNELFTFSISFVRISVSSGVGTRSSLAKPPSSIDICPSDE